MLNACFKPLGFTQISSKLTFFIKLLKAGKSGPWGAKVTGARWEPAKVLLILLPTTIAG